MSERTTLRSIKQTISDLLDEAYLEHDKIQMSRAGHIEHLIIKERRDTLKEVAKIVGVHHIERKRCALGSCGTLMPRNSASKYCSNACKQKNYRISLGQMKK
jgi:hypothetical protein